MSEIFIGCICFVVGCYFSDICEKIKKHNDKKLKDLEEKIK